MSTVLDDFRHPMAWHGEEEATGVFIGPADDELSLLDMPTGAAVRRRLALRGDAAVSAAVAAVLVDIQSALEALATGDGAGKILPLDGFSDEDRALLTEALGDGEVQIALGGEPDYQIHETVLPGVWRGRATGRNGACLADWIEVAEVPGILREAARTLCLARFEPPSEAPDGAMNVLPVLAEIAARMEAWRDGQPNHVMNFTLLPMTETDTEFLTETLGRLPLSIVSSGYGRCRVGATHYANVWSVQYLNAMDTIILDTLEIGDVPVSVRAAREDFEDSAERLREIREAYLA